jgi:alkaline phosphatase D
MFLRIAYGGILVALSCGIDALIAAEPAVERIALAGCHRQDWPAPAMFRYVDAKPDLMIWLGDNIYADTKDDVAHIEKCYGLLSAHPAFAKLKKDVPMAATWDDHDFGSDNVGKDYALKEQSKQLFRKFWGIESYVPEDRDGIYHAQYFGDGDERLQVILLDVRFNRENEGDDSDTLGENQWAWLAEELRQPARLRLIASGYQVLLDRATKFETWSKFPKAQQRLFKTIRDAQAEGVVFLAGDQHYGEASRRPGALGYDAIELMFCGINQEEPHVFNSYRVTPVAHAKNAYALVDVQWQASETDAPHFVFRCFDANRDVPELTYRVNLNELRILAK